MYIRNTANGWSVRQNPGEAGPEDGEQMIRGRVEIVGELGKGGLGILFKCRDEQGLLFAVKFPKSGSFTSQAMLEEEERRLVRHQGPNVVAYFGRVRLANGAVGLALELMDGDLTKLGRLSPELALQYLEGVIHGLADLHRSAQGAFHGDLKRANVLVKGGKAKLTDFGLARGGIGQTVMVGPHQGGTPGYFPPEGFTSQAGDMYSLGALIWASLLDQEPLPQQSLSIQIANHPRLERVVNRLLTQDPAQRPTVFQLQQELPALRAEAKAQTAAASDPLWDFLKAVACVAGIVWVAGAVTSK